MHSNADRLHMPMNCKWHAPPLNLPPRYCWKKLLVFHQSAALSLFPSVYVSLSLPLSPPTSSLPLRVHTYISMPAVAQQDLGTSAGPLRSQLLILMGKGLWVQLQVTLRVAQEVGGMRKSPWKWLHHQHGNDG